MSRGESFGGGQSSLGYLFEPDECPPTIKDSKTQKPPSDDGKMKAAGQVTQPAAKPNSNNYRRAHGPNMGNFITGRPSTRVQSAPGGCSSLGYLFGDN